MTAVSTDNSGFSEIEKLLINENVVSEQDIAKAKSETLAFNKKAMMPLGLIIAKENGLGEADIAKILNNYSIYETSAELIKNDKALKTTDISELIKKNKSVPRLLSELAQNNIISANKKNALLNKILNLKKTATTLADTGLVPCLLYTSPSPRDLSTSRMPSSA
eukprot:TRINITY_DN8834_c0_g1_i1.p2 TRINITY_DN8834_c0_g1~~TRINITY_DN8834_c0_g1_i1.p2  ORF type:complete len:164 (-),score=41.08 TRINITY_DN8834_c0_g1_i1:135-626(-)